MVLPQSSYKSHFPSSLLARAAIEATTFLDAHGGRTWSLRLVAATSTAVLLSMRRTVGLYGGIEWHALVHAAVVGFGAWACRSLDSLDADGAGNDGYHHQNYRDDDDVGSCAIVGWPRPTSLHRLLPALTLGYSVCDVLDSMKLGRAFVMHGLATSAVMAFFCEWGATGPGTAGGRVSHLVTPMLLMELSTIPLATVRATFYTSTMQVASQLFFVLAFFVVRILWVPRIWWTMLGDVYRTMQAHASSSASASASAAAAAAAGAASDGDCGLRVVLVVMVVFGTFFHGLNAYWFYRMILKIKRKLAGKEKSDNVEME